jgi:hypothetical protein
MWRRLDIMWTEVLAERIASFFKAEKTANEEPAWAGDCIHVPPKRRFKQDLHGATSQKTTFFKKRGLFHL